MIVDLRPLRAERGATLVIACHEVVASEIPEVPFDEPVAGELTLINTGSVLQVTGRLETSVALACDRCAKSFRRRLETTVEEALDWAGGQFLAAAGGAITLDTGALAREALVLALPMVSLCDEACPGLCDRCGADLGEGPCACQRELADPRLAPLQRLRIDADDARSR